MVQAISLSFFYYGEEDLDIVLEVFAVFPSKNFGTCWSMTHGQFDMLFTFYYFICSLRALFSSVSLAIDSCMSFFSANKASSLFLNMH